MVAMFIGRDAGPSDSQSTTDAAVLLLSGCPDFRNLVSRIARSQAPGLRPPSTCLWIGCTKTTSRRFSDAVMSGVVDSGRERGHGNVDANDPKGTLRHVIRSRG